MCAYAAWRGEVSSVNRSQGWDPPKAACYQTIALPLFTSKLRSAQPNPLAHNTQHRAFRRGEHHPDPGGAPE
jgi:hypothetical protein